MGADIPGIVRLKCSVKKYAWGTVGREESSVARLYAKNNGQEIDVDEPYAEFWMGTHESGPSYVVEANGGFSNGRKLKCCDSVGLKEWIQQNPSVLGDKVLQRWGPDLPFLLKVLSVAKALSIQAHPDKSLAAILHKRKPDVYKDANHKPEMALAITHFEALCGFVDLQELKSVVQNVPEIVEVVGTAAADQVSNMTKDVGEKKMKDILQSLFTKLMSVSKGVISEVLLKLISRLNRKCEAGELTSKEELVLRLEKQYPGDVGVIAAFLLNYVRLNPAEALYIDANEPHAYIHGECVECMATSDNVVRAGLTPKNRDVQTLCSMLTYKQGFPEIHYGIPSSNPYTVKYVPPFDEFEVDRCILPRETQTVFPALPGPSVFVVVSGEGAFLTFSKEVFVVIEGDVLFAPANTEIAVQTASASGLNLFRAGINSRFFE
ncbi:mannose-6-phosphate isomerase 2-like [Andrographis paniculata]|uniref:mannose-6-phosphate isomerase 2-like n=1 Tax=Andrographis paniculata TaxID=175694 RepID=UPI0021E7C32A|nr:mannose-6-phosphate isomerase 2-like [Andrographis paniculata]